MFVVGLVSACIAAPVVGGTIEFPAQGNFDIEEGTIEMWFAPETDLYIKLDPGKVRTILRFFSLDAPEFGFNCRWEARRNKKDDETGYTLRVSMSSSQTKGGLIPVPGGRTPRDWKRGEFHHIAFTWKDGMMQLYCDGAFCGSRRQVGWFTGKLGPAKLVFGSPGGSSVTRYRIHAVRTSCVARDERMLRNAKPQSDLATLLLQVFDAPETVRGDKTVPRQTSALDGDPYGTIVGKGRFVPGAPASFAFGK
jgi:hypothetical protein